MLLKLLLLVLLLPLQAWLSSDEVVDKAAYEMGEDDDEEPDDLIVGIVALVLDAVDEHPDPEDGAEYSDGKDEE